MPAIRIVRTVAGVAAAGLGIASAAYAGLVASAWFTYGRPGEPGAGEQDELLDRFMPAYDVVERHRIFIDAPAATVVEAAKAQNLMQLPLVRAIFKAREVALGAASDHPLPPNGLLATVQSLGWVVLAERPGREIVVGAVTRPWEANVTFRALPPEQFAAYDEPGNVKIVWTLRAKPVGEQRCVFLTETRAVATDATARRRFRAYWAFASPGISTIRWLSLMPLKREAERRARTPAAA